MSARKSPPPLPAWHAFEVRDLLVYADWQQALRLLQTAGVRGRAKQAGPRGLARRRSAFQLGRCFGATDVLSGPDGLFQVR